jgi:hypothetical protein
MSFFSIFFSVSVGELLERVGGGVNVHRNRGVVFGCVVLMHVGVSWCKPSVFEIGVINFTDTYDFFSSGFFPFV